MQDPLRKYCKDKCTECRGDSNTSLFSFFNEGLLPACLKSNYSRLFNSSARSLWDKYTLFRLASPLPLDGSEGLFKIYPHGLGHVINYSTEQRLLMESSKGVCVRGQRVCVQEGKLLWWDTVYQKVAFKRCFSLLGDIFSFIVFFLTRLTWKCQI